MDTYADKLAQDVTGAFLSTFDKKDIEGILLFGSHSAKFVNKYSDLDIWIIFKKYSNTQLEKLKKIHDEYRPRGLSLQAKWMDELQFKDDSLASHKGNGQFLIWELQRSLVLFGENPFLNIKINHTLVYQSVVVKIEKMLTEYRKLIVKDVELKPELKRDIFKHIIRASRYMILAGGKVAKKISLWKDLDLLYPNLLRKKDREFLIERHSKGPKHWETLSKSKIILCIDILRTFYLRLIK